MAILLLLFMQAFMAPNQREHTFLLNRRRVNKGMKRANSLPLSPAVLTRPHCRENRYLQDCVALTSYLGFSALCDFFFFALCIKFDKGGNSLLKHFERNPNIRSNLWISLLSRNQTNTKRTRKIFLQFGRIYFRILQWQSVNLSVFCKVFFSNRV